MIAEKVKYINSFEFSGRTAPGGLLRAPPDGLAQAADMARVVPDAERQLNEGGDPAAGPDLPPEAIGFGPVVQQLGQTSQLVGR